MKHRLSSIIVLSLLALFMFAGMYGCAGTLQAIDHAKMQTTVKMSDSIFLDPIYLAKNRNIYVRMTNTSEMQEIQIEGMLKDMLTRKGMNIVSDPSQAGYMLQINVLHMDYEKKGSMTADGLLAGGFGGALAGASMGRGGYGTAAGGLIGGVIGSVGGAIAGSLVHVDAFIGAVDLQIQEKVEGGVTGTMVTNTGQGSATALRTQREIRSDYQTYRSRIVARAVQTNIDKMEAARILSEKLATQISSMF